MKTYILTYRLPNGFELHIVSNKTSKTEATQEAIFNIHRHISNNGNRSDNIILDIANYNIQPTIEEWNIKEARVSNIGKPFNAYIGGINPRIVNGAGIKSAVSNIVKQSGGNASLFPIIIYDPNQPVKQVQGDRYIVKYRSLGSELYVFIPLAISYDDAKSRANRVINILMHKHKAYTDSEGYSWGEEGTEFRIFSMFKGVESDEVHKLSSFKSPIYFYCENKFTEASVISIAPNGAANCNVKSRSYADDDAYDKKFYSDIFGKSNNPEADLEELKNTMKLNINIVDLYRKALERDAKSGVYCVIVTKCSKSKQIAEDNWDTLNRRIEELNAKTKFVVSFKMQNSARLYDWVTVGLKGIVRRTPKEDIVKQAIQLVNQLPAELNKDIDLISEDNLVVVTEADSRYATRITYPDEYSDIFAVTMHRDGITKNSVIAKNNKFYLDNIKEHAGCKAIYDSYKIDPIDFCRHRLDNSDCKGIVLYSKFNPEIAGFSARTGYLKGENAQLFMEYTRTENQKRLAEERLEREKRQAEEKQERERRQAEERQVRELQRQQAEADRIAKLEENRRQREEAEARRKEEEARRAVEAEKRRLEAIEKQRQAELAKQAREEAARKAEEDRHTALVNREFAKLRQIRVSIENDINNSGSWSVDFNAIARAEKKLEQLRLGIAKFNSITTPKDRQRLLNELQYETSMIKEAREKIQHLKSGRTMRTYGKRGALWVAQGILNGRFD